MTLQCYNGRGVICLDLSGFPDFFLMIKVVLRIYFSSGKGRKLSLKKKKNSGAPQKKGIWYNLQSRKWQPPCADFPEFFLIVVDSF